MPFVGGFPEEVAGDRVEADDAGVAAGVHDELIVPYEGTGAAPEEEGSRPEVVVEVSLPDHFAALQPAGEQVTGEPHGEDQPAFWIDDGPGPWGVGDPITRAHFHGSGPFPEQAAAGRVMALDDLFPVDEVDEHEAAVGDDGSGMALAVLDLPEHGRAGLRKFAEKTGLRGVRVVVRAEEAGPVPGSRGREKEEGEDGELDGEGFHDRVDRVKQGILEGKVALVTGASSGIGRATAVRLAGGGVRLILTARRRERLEACAAELREGGAEAHVIPANLASEEEVARLVREAAGRWGRLDILVNSAGLALQAPLRDGDAADWEAMWRINVQALALVSREALRVFDGESGGHIVNLCSMSGHRVPGRGGFYAATKFAVRALTEGLRQELRAADDQTRVSQVSPGFVDTELLDAYFETGTGGRYERVPYEMLHPEDVAETIWHILTAPPHADVTDVLLRPTQQKT